MKKINTKNVSLGTISKFIVTIILVFFVAFQFLIIIENDKFEDFVTLDICPLNLPAEIDIFDNNFENKYLNYEEISVVPDLELIFCLGKVKSINVESNNLYISVYSSNNFYSVYNYIGNLLIILFSIYINKRIFFFSIITVFNFLNMIIFFNPSNNPQMFFKYLVIYFFSIILFLIFDKHGQEIRLFDYLTILLLFSLVSSYQLFGNLLIIYFLIFFWKEEFTTKNNLKKYHNIIVYTPITFFFIRLVAGTTDQLNLVWRLLTPDIAKTYVRFGDMQLALRSIKCNFSNIFEYPQIVKFDTNLHYCPFETGYPLVDTLISYQISNIWFTSLGISTVLIVLFSYQYLFLINKFDNFKFYIFLFVVSPSFNFLIERMNLDFLIIILLFFIIYNYKEKQFTTSLTLIFTSMSKYFTFPMLISLSVSSFIKKKNLYGFMYLSSFLLFLSFIVYYFLSLGEFKFVSTFSNEEFFYNTLSNPSLSFGLLSNLSYLTNYLEISNLIFLYTLIFIICCVLINRKYLFEIRENNLDEITKVYNFLPVLILVLLYQNIDYRIPLFLFVVPLILSFDSKSLTLIFYFFVLTSSMNFFIINEIINYLNIFSQIFLKSFLIIIYFKYLKNLKKLNTAL